MGGFGCGAGLNRCSKNHLAHQGPRLFFFSVSSISNLMVAFKGMASANGPSEDWHPGTGLEGLAKGQSGRPHLSAEDEQCLPDVMQVLAVLQVLDVLLAGRVGPTDGP